MQATYAKWVPEMGVLEMPDGYSPLQQIGATTAPIMPRNYWPWLVAALLLLSGLLGLLLFVGIRICRDAGKRYRHRA